MCQSAASQGDESERFNINTLINAPRSRDMVMLGKERRTPLLGAGLVRGNQQGICRWGPVRTSFESFWRRWRFYHAQ